MVMIMLNRKGFMMAEVIVVSAIILLCLTAMYSTYNKIYTRYKTVLNYYDASTIYQLMYYRDILIEGTSEDGGNEFMSKIAMLQNNPVVELFNDVSIGDGEDEDIEAAEEIDRVFLVRSSSNKIKSDDFNGVDINLTYKDYIKYLETSTTFDSNYIMLIEKCNADKVNCKYGYIEIYDGYES